MPPGSRFLLSKLVGAATRPETFLVLLPVVALMALWRGWLGIARWTLGTVVVALGAVAILPVGHLVLVPLEARYPEAPELQAPAGIVVLGGGEDPDATRRWEQPTVTDGADRFLAAIALARRFPEAPVIYTGGAARLLGRSPSEARVAARVFTMAGLERDRLVLEGRARNTAENARFTRALVSPGSDGPWVLVTSAHHMPRAVATFCAAGWSEVVPWPTDYRTGAFAAQVGWDLAGHLAALNTGVKEWVGLISYRLLGRTERLLDRGCVAG